MSGAQVAPLGADDGERIAEKTVKNYVSSLLAKLGMERRTQAAVFASKMLHEHQ